MQRIIIIIIKNNLFSNWSALIRGGSLRCNRKNSGPCVRTHIAENKTLGYGLNTLSAFPFHWVLRIVRLRIEILDAKTCRELQLKKFRSIFLVCLFLQPNSNLEKDQISGLQFVLQNLFPRLHLELAQERCDSALISSFKARSHCLRAACWKFVNDWSNRVNMSLKA